VLLALVFSLMLVSSTFTSSIIPPLLIFITVLFECYLDYKFGSGDFSNVKLIGPYEVGFKELKAEEHHNNISVFYPIEKQEYASKIRNEGANPRWLRHGMRDIEA
jgi:hypothetical protein